jgi:hypothetical protein
MQWNGVRQSGQLISRLKFEGSVMVSGSAGSLGEKLGVFWRLTIHLCVCLYVEMRRYAHWITPLCPSVHLLLGVSQGPGHIDPDFDKHPTLRTKNKRVLLTMLTCLPLPVRRRAKAWATSTPTLQS